MNDVEYSMEIINDRFRIWQPKQGYRFNLDSLLLAGFVHTRKNMQILDIGTGTGVIPLLLFSKEPALQITGVEIQPILATLALRNARENGLENWMVLGQDVKTLGPSYANRFHVVVCNPPYFRHRAAILSRHPMEQDARHETLLRMEDLFLQAYRLMRPKGHFYCIYPINRLDEALCMAHQSKMHPLRLRLIHSKADKKARAFLLHAGKDAGRQMVVEKPLILHQANGDYTEEYKRVMGGGTLDESSR